MQPGPGPTTAPVVEAISPNSGTTLGGTQIAITGNNFAAGATVTVGGAAATGVVITSATSVTATTPQHAAGTVDVTVNVGARSGSLSSAFTYVAPVPISNQPPVIQGVVAQGSRPNEPVNLADLNEEITVSARVIDAEVTPDLLVYEWSATDGTFTGTGPSVTWRAPMVGSTPFVANLKLVVVDRFQTTDGSGLPITSEHRVENSVAVRVHDAVKEVGDMSTTFLQDFSKSSVPPDVVMQNFLVGCDGTEAEREQVEENRVQYLITNSSVGSPMVTINFQGVCSIRNVKGDACSYSAVRWESIKKANGEREIVEGQAQLAAVYRGNRWWLCDSQFDGIRVLGTGFFRLLTREW